MRKKVALHNLGCKVNAYETEAMQQMLIEAGYSIVPFAPGADIYIINTCTVTNIADRKSRQMLHKAKKMNDKAIVVAAGCYVQAGKENQEIDQAIDIVIGNNKKQDLIQILNTYEHGDGKNCRQEMIADISQPMEYENLQLDRTGEHTRAYIKVQDGCNQFCSYCIIPYVRGRVRSRRKEEVIEQIKRLTMNGYKEFVLTGIHLSSYGVDCEESLLSLIQAIHSISGVKRIRLGSLEPGVITEEFIREIYKMPKLCPHFHLSLQSGCDETLTRMNRRYRTSKYQEKCNLLRGYFENPALTTDIIVGFPMETEEEFRRSLEFIKEIGFYEIHVFKYSKREGTKAAVMPRQVSEERKMKRSRELIALGSRLKKEYMESLIGKNAEILIEEETQILNEFYWTGYTREYLKVGIRCEKNLKNKIIMGEIRGFLTKDIMICEI